MIKPIAYGLFVSAFLIMGFLSAAWQIVPLIQRTFPKEVPEKIYGLTGIIDSEIEHSTHSLRFYFKTYRQSIDAHPDEPRVDRVLLTVAPALLSHPLKKGQTWKFKAKMHAPHTITHEGLVDYPHFLIERYVSQGHVIKSPQNQFIRAPAHLSLRERVRQHIESSVPSRAFLGVILGLLVGMRDVMTPEQWEVLRRTGTNHLVVIAGLHIGLLYHVIYQLVFFIGRQLPWLMYVAPIPPLARWIGFIGACGYAILSGLALPTQRAISMMALGFLFQQLGHPLPKRFIFLGTLVFLLCLEPTASISMTGWLSFFCVGVFFYALSGTVVSGTVKEFIWAQTAITLGLIPFNLYFFQQNPALGFVANALAIPVVGYAIIPLSFFALGLSWIWPLAATTCFSLVEKLLSALWHMLSVLSHQTQWIWEQAIYDPAALCLATLGMLYFLMPRGTPGKHWCIVLWALALSRETAQRPSPPPVQQVRCTVLEVGQGLSAVVQTAHHTLVFDTGPAWRPVFDSGERIVIPYLKYLRISKIDKLIISHGDNDHIGGSFSILERFPNTPILTSVPERFAPPWVARCTAGQHWQWDGVDFWIDHPTEQTLWKGNNASCVLRVSTPSHQLIIPGDIEWPAEQEILRRNPDYHADVLIAPHHGSTTSSSLEWINAVRPQWVIMPVGFANRFHFPKPEIIERYRSHHASIIRTDECGSIVFTMPSETNEPIERSCHRKQHLRYWR